jgi:DNA-binding FadR family transcriptional regulator
MFAETQSEVGLDVLDSLIQREDAAVSNLEAFTEPSIAFHRAITDHCGNEVLATFGAVLQLLLKDVTPAFTSANPELPAVLQAVVVAHRELAGLIRHGDASGAKEHWEQYLEWLTSLNPLGDMPFGALSDGAGVLTDRTVIID